MSEPEPFVISASMYADDVFTATLTDNVDTLAEIWFTMRQRWATESTADDSDALLQVTLGNGIVVTGVKTVSITLPFELKAGIKAGLYPADLKALAVNGSRPYVAASGHVRLNPVAGVSTA